MTFCTLNVGLQPTNNHRAKEKEKEEEKEEDSWPQTAAPGKIVAYIYMSSYMLADNKTFRDYNAEKVAGGQL